MQFVKADTAVKVVMGPFVDVGDGFTPETAVTLTGGGDNADEAELLKHDNATTVDISANTWAALTGVDGYYHLTLTAGNLDTEGQITIVIQNDSVHLPVKKELMCVNANVYDSLFAAAATDYLRVDLFQVAANGTTPGEINSLLPGSGAVSVGGDMLITGQLEVRNTGGADASVLFTPDSGEDCIRFNATGAGKAMSGNGMDNFADLNNLGVTRVTLTGTPSTTSLTTTFTAPATDSHKDMIAVVVTAAGPEGEARRITANTNGASSTFTISPALSAAPASGQEVLILGRSTT